MNIKRTLTALSKLCLDVPYKVVINEAVELTKIFGAEESHKYVNSILDKAAVKLRAVEIMS